MSAAAFMRVKKLTGAGIVLAAAKHNRRALAAELGAGGHIDPTRSHLNVTMNGPSSPQAVAALAKKLMAAAGITKLRRDAVRAVEVVFSLPAGQTRIEPAAYFARCVEWARVAFGPVLSADAHHDEAAPHAHVLCLPLADGRMRGSDLVGGPTRLRALQTDFHAQVAQTFGLKRGTGTIKGHAKAKAAAVVLDTLRAGQDPALRSLVWPALRDAIERDPRPFADALGFDADQFKAASLRTFTQIMTSRGKGARTHAEEQRRDRQLQQHNAIGFAGAANGRPRPNHKSL